MNYRRTAAYYIKRNGDREVKNVNNILEGLTFSQMVILVFLKEHDYSAKQADVIEYLGVKRSTIIGMVKVMEKNGLITTGPDPNQGRIKILTATQKGIDLLDNYVLNGENRFYNMMFEGISEEEIKNLAKTLIKINENLENNWD
jgi:DNA-binding MarR family transcriptional regulator